MKQSWVLDESTRRRLISRYRNGALLRELRDEFGITIAAAHSLIKRRGLIRPRVRKLHGLHRGIVKRYLAGESTNRIARRLDTSPTEIVRVLQSNGVPRRNASAAHRKHTLDEAVLARVTEQSAYWIGFLMADGCVTDHGTIHVTLSKKDEAHLRRLRRFFKSSAPVRQCVAAGFKGYTSRPAVRLDITSQILSHALKQRGVIPRKSLVAKVIGLENNRHFWRGVVDGDGTIDRNGRAVLRLTGAKPLLSQFKRFVESSGARALLTKRPEARAWDVRTCGDSARAIAQMLYQNARVSLKRKHDRARLIWRKK